MTGYDPIERGPFEVEERSFEARDAARDRVFPCTVWRPSAAGAYPLIVYSHYSGGHRRAATFLTAHLASHGYTVAALDHSETFVPELKAQDGETAGEMAVRGEAVLANRVPDVRFLIERAWDGTSPIGLVGHSMGGWTVLAAPETDERIGAIVAMAPAGASNPRPGIAPAKLTFRWRREAPVLYLVADNDVALPLSGMYELLERTPSAKRMAILRRADHGHFVDEIEALHEGFRTLPLKGWMTVLEPMQQEMRPFAELCPAEGAHRFVRGHALAHFDAYLKDHRAARRFLETIPDRTREDAVRLGRTA